MNWYVFTGTVATVSMFVPALLILIFKLFNKFSLLILSVYYILTGFFNLMNQGLITVPGPFQNKVGVLFNYLDAPMMLMVLLFFCTERCKLNTINYSLALYGLYEVVIFYLFRLSPQSSVYVLGPGILLVLCYSIYLFFQQGKLTVMYGKGLGLTLMLVSILFSYGCFSFIYVLYYIKKTSALADVFLIYYIVLFISSVLLSLGIIWLHKRIRNINEVQVSRKELAHFFEV